MINKNKKAQMHLEIILSLVIFVGFVLFILIFLNPTKDYSDNSVQLDKISKIILKNISQDYKEISLSLNNMVSSSCFSIENPKSNYYNFVVTNSSNDLVESYRSGNNIIIKNSKDIFFKIHYSSFFNSSNINSCSNPIIRNENYTFGAMFYDSIISYESLLNLNQLYLADYSAFKANNNINSDFTFVVYDHENILINDSLSKIKNTGRVIISRNIPIKVFEEDMTSKDLILNLRVYT